MHIIEIVLDGFKSYATRTVISGFDSQFNAITGLNGSGKSNVLDSICFVLGISNLSQVRASNLNELIYKQGQAGVSRASVTLVFDNSDRNLSPHGYEHYNQITVTRQVAVGGRNKYLINGSTAQLQRVQNLFHSVQLNVNNPHFLIMQGRITKVLNMKPIEILGLIEEAAGTRMFEMKKQQAIKTIEKKESKLDEIKRVINEDITPRLEKLGAERADYLEYTGLASGVESLARFCQAYDYYAAFEAKLACEATHAEGDEQKASLEEAIKGCEETAGRLKREILEIQSRKAKEGTAELHALEAAEQELGKQLVKVSTELSQLRQLVEADEGTREGVSSSIKELEVSEKSLGAEHLKACASAERARAAHAERAQSLRQKQTQYEADMGMSSGVVGEGVKNLQGQLSDVTAAVSSHETELKAAQLKEKHLAKEAKELEKRLGAAKKAGGKSDKAHAQLSDAVGAIRKKLAAEKHDETLEPRLTAEHEAARKQASALSREEEEMASTLSHLDFKYADPEKKWDRRRVKGTVAANLSVRDGKNATALEAFAAGRLHQVVVDNEKTGMLLLTKGQLQRRVTLIPLSKISPKPLPPSVVAEAKKLVGADKADLALNLIEYPAELAPAMAYVFGSGIVCADQQAARTVCETLRVKTVTLEGDLYDPAGTLTGGSRARGTAGVLSRLATLQQVRAKLGEASGALEKLAADLEACRKRGERVASLQEELELKAHQLQLQETVEEQSESHQLARNLEALETQRSETSEAISTAKQALADASALKKSLTAQLSDFEGNREERLAQAKSALKKAEKELKAEEKALQAQQQAEQRLTLQGEELAAQRKALDDQLAELAQRDEAQRARLAAKEAEELAKKEEYDGAMATLTERRRAFDAFDEQVAALQAQRDEAVKRGGDAELELKQLEHRQGRAHKELKEAEGACRELIKRHPWIEAEKGAFGQKDGEYDFSKRKPSAVQAQYAKQQSQLDNLSKRINKKVLAMFEKAEQEYADLMGKRETVEKDKAKIEAVINELGQKKIEALQLTHAKVNTDFGSIFSTLLPGTQAKLEPQEGQPIEDGLCVKVAFGSVWKQSLLELSGGQRSLVALSLVLSLLRFKPAPVYILDEIDAALDLSHTQNIGQMIRTHFQQSQFLVVSLKEGMFNNANVLFRTKFVDGVSTITRTVPQGAAAAAARDAHAEPKQKATKGAAAAKGRKALTVSN